MAFGHASLPTRKYAYGAREFLPRTRGSSEPIQPFEGRNAALEQMRKAGEFQNELVELERDRRAAVEAALTAARPQVGLLLVVAEGEQSALARLRTELATANSRAQELVSDPDLIERIREQEGITNAAWSEYRSERSAAFADPVVKSLLASLDATDATAKKEARTAAVECGLYWATSLQVATRVKKIGPPPRRKRWDGEEVISVQFQRKPDRNSPKVPVLDAKGKPRIHPRSGKPMMTHEGGSSVRCDDMYQPNSLCWIERTGLEIQVPFLPSRNGREYVVVHFRVGSTTDGKPIWARIPTVLHRPLPEGGEVKWAHLSARRIGTHFKWEVLFDVAKPEWNHHPAKAGRATEGTVAIALGWRIIDGTIRVAEWVGSDGVMGTVRIPDDIVDQWRELEGLQSVRDRLFDESILLLRDWLRGRTITPEWEHWTATLGQWNSPNRLRRLVWWWHSHRLPDDKVIFERLNGVLVRHEGKYTCTGGRKQDRHLADWQAHLRAQLIAWRKDFYRHIAIDLSQQYKSVVVAEIDWNAIAENSEVEDDDEKVNKTNRAMSACATLRDCFTNYLDEVTVSAEHITDTCAVCGKRVPHPCRGRWIRCERCSDERMDRAENAARNLLLRGTVDIGGGVPARTV